jgi:hypothetical protein
MKNVVRETQQTPLNCCWMWQWNITKFQAEECGRDLNFTAEFLKTSRN